MAAIQTTAAPKRAAAPKTVPATIANEALAAPLPVDADHPALDRNPRRTASADSQRIDFNDPTKTEQEAVLANLGGDASDAGDTGAAE